MLYTNKNVTEELCHVISYSQCHYMISLPCEFHIYSYTHIHCMCNVTVSYTYCHNMCNVTMSQCHILIFTICCSILLSQCHSVTYSLSQYVLVSYCHNVTLWRGCLDMWCNDILSDAHIRVQSFFVC